MLAVSNEYKQAILSDTRQFKLRCIINKKTYTEEDITTVNWSGGAISGETFAIGSTVAADAKIVFSHIVEGIAEAQKFKIEIGIVLPSGKVEYIPLGIFLVTKFDQKRNDNQTVIEGMDRFIQMEGPYKSKLNYPARIKDVAVEIANLAGIPVNLASFERLLTEKIEKPEGYTLRQAIGLIAQFEGGFAVFNRNGELEIRQLTDPHYTVYPSNYYSKGLDKNEALYRINGIQVKTDQTKEPLTIGNLTGNQILLDNKVMTKHLLTGIYNRVFKINFYPFQLKWQGDPALEAGDWLTIVDLKGNPFKVPNLSYSLSFNGGLSGISSATQKSISQTSYQSKGTLNQIVDDIHGWISAGGGNWTYEGLDTPLNPKEGDTWFKPNGPDIEIWRYERNQHGALDWIPKISTALKQELADEFEKQKADLEQAKKQISENNAKAQQALIDAGFAKNGLSAVEKQATEALKQAEEAYDHFLATDASITELKWTTSQVEKVTNQLTGELSQKVSQATFDQLKGTVKNQEALLNQTAEGLEAKASITSVDAINKLVSQHTTNLTVQGDKLRSLVTETDDVKVKLSQLEQTSAGFQRTVLDQLKGVTSQQTQLAGQYTRVIETIGGLNGKATNINAGWEIGSIARNGGKPIDFPTTVRSTGFIEVEAEKPYMVVDGQGDLVISTMVFYDENKQLVAYRTEQTVSRATSRSRYLKVVVLKGDQPLHAIDYAVIQSAQPQKAAIPIRSQLTQTADRFNVTIQKGDIIAQLNIEAGRTLIQNKQLVLDADTVTFTGEAFIPMAKIKDLKVDAAKIYGTLNAKNVIITNLDATNISSGYINNERLRSRSITADKLAANAIQVGFNNYSQNLQLNPWSLDFRSKNTLTGRLTSKGMEFWHGTRKIGRMGENSKSGKDNVRGIVMDLEYTGDFVGWSYMKHANDQAYTSMLLLDPKGKFTGKSGIHMDTDVYLSRIKPNYTDAKEFLKFATINYNNYHYSGLLNNSGKSGIFMGGNWLYLLHNTYVIPVEDIKKVVYALKGLGKIHLPTSFFASGGGVRNYKTITL